MRLVISSSSNPSNNPRAIDFVVVAISALFSELTNNFKKYREDRGKVVELVKLLHDKKNIDALEDHERVFDALKKGNIVLTFACLIEAGIPITAKNDSEKALFKNLKFEYSEDWNWQTLNDELLKWYDSVSSKLDTSENGDRKFAANLIRNSILTTKLEKVGDIVNALPSYGCEVVKKKEQPTTSSNTEQPTTSSNTDQLTTSSNTEQPTTSSNTEQPTTSSSTNRAVAKKPAVKPQQLGRTIKNFLESKGSDNKSCSGLPRERERLQIFLQNVAVFGKSEQIGFMNGKWQNIWVLVGKCMARLYLAKQQKDSDEAEKILQGWISQFSSEEQKFRTILTVMEECKEKFKNAKLKEFRYLTGDVIPYFVYEPAKGMEKDDHFKRLEVCFRSTKIPKKTRNTFVRNYISMMFPKGGLDIKNYDKKGFQETMKHCYIMLSHYLRDVLKEGENVTNHTIWAEQLAFAAEAVIKLDKIYKLDYKNAFCEFESLRNDNLGYYWGDVNNAGAYNMERAELGRK